MQLAAVILAAGKGTRMKSQLPKVMHRVCGKAMVEHVLLSVKNAGVQKIVMVLGHQGERVANLVGDKAEIAYQVEQLGTAHALLQTRGLLGKYEGDILVLCGDTPLVRPETLNELYRQHIKQKNSATVLTAILPDPKGYGRIIRNNEGNLEKIVEQKDGKPEELAVNEINAGIYCFCSEGLFEALAALDANNAQGEYYLTDIIQYYAREGKKVGAVVIADPEEITGINDRCQLAAVESMLRRRILERLMMSGVTIVDPASTFIDDSVEIGPDSVIYPYTFIEGKSKIGENCIIGPSTRLVNSTIGSGVTVQNSIILESSIADGCNIGPFAYIRPGCVLEARVKVGDFVELKNARLGQGSKVPHLSYVGDARVGSGANIGAGTITCNYDGEKKSLTVIGNKAFIGSNTNLVAPVVVGEGAYTGAGSTITRDVPAGALGVARGKQKNISDWAEKRKRLPGNNQGDQ
ncbi:bifunctional UDP-N-acetylglucosamine diphosphorylase/glucosamine-1-phosphate N-acetyltransferase GlmU [Desulfotruncus alcoholivorax]|uniref:bifunctional UDP-N-acetylglucosamine diphosphorylase/glucosamine-1-phosphate N-acetyltransferase GlmU n=1 Tax=Desulfotruncus alcoholivorax TaxID=265477 RepID=UPI00041A23FF|nr:bifunctional UDP-N-acetylglucosamine diphosphorylase/glucosamine-1-phosphate N-acetyltransferase GlmU [Desulfotruncus alcoholivorax]